MYKSEVEHILLLLYLQLEMPNVMAALPNIGGTLCSTLQSLADAQYSCAVLTLPKCETR